jgi:hypothetical protein
MRGVLESDHCTRANSAVGASHGPMPEYDGVAEQARAEAGPHRETLAQHWLERRVGAIKGTRSPYVAQRCALAR